jgi:hypothetical protein
MMGGIGVPVAGWGAPSTTKDAPQQIRGADRKEVFCMAQLYTQAVKNDEYERLARESAQRPLNPPQIEQALAGFVPVLAAEDNECLAGFCAAKGIGLGALTIMGARANGVEIAYPYAAGVKFRRMDGSAYASTGTDRRMWGRFRNHPLPIFYGREPYARAVLSESETDAAALIDAYPDADVAVMPLGASVWSDVWTAQFAGVYVIVHVATDADAAGEQAWENIWRTARVPGAVRHAPPKGFKDWAEALREVPNGT